MRINFTGIIDNLQHVTGTIIGATFCKISGYRFKTEQRNTLPFSTVAANNAAEGIVVWFPYVVIVK